MKHTFWLQYKIPPSPMWFCVFFLISSFSVEAEEMKEMQCTKEELLSFFPKQIVQNVLLQFQIPAAKASEVADELATKNQELIQMVEQKAAVLDPNPFKDPTQREKAIQIYQEVLHDVLAQVLQSHEIAAGERVDVYLQEIRKVKSQLFVQCIRSQQSS